MSLSDEERRIMVRLEMERAKRTLNEVEITYRTRSANDRNH